MKKLNPETGETYKRGEALPFRTRNQTNPSRYDK
jgi:hypothetical protein